MRLPPSRPEPGGRLDLRLGGRLTGTMMDIASAVGALAVMLSGELFTSEATAEPMRAVPLLLLLAGAGSLAVLSRFPPVTAVVLALATPLYYILGPVDAWTGWFAFAVGVFRLAAESHRPSAITATAGALAVFSAGEIIAFQPARSLMVLAWLIVVLAAGELARSRRAYLREVEQRAVEAARNRAEEERRRATEERLRIAREVHDVVAHSISLINVQAGAAAHRRDPEQAYAALEEIRRASKDTLRELRATLGVLRQVDEDDGAAASVDPAPSLSGIEELADRTRESGIAVEVMVEGERSELTTSIDMAAYRIVQEALTNVRRHAQGATRVSVAVRRSAEVLTVQVDDDGGGAADTAVREGNGLRGMRERTSAVGGEFGAGPGPNGGFRVRAVLPIGEDRGSAPHTSG
ncbi:signal transduction histidine kinase [Nocardiopsis mwathae]|uniref:histidine kinase n=1 Tax=Nocardiopsis mwathae TaxID=1472723 RepID=A0A7W9YMC3_9ACTN|nr:sensor histidine kinase [Nocardiopsis mwathae]MBB6174789.1 signal transduction histidine kinase [Nocardiopsis mwathae]